MENNNTAVDAEVVLEDEEAPVAEAVAEETGTPVTSEPAKDGEATASEEIDVSIGDSPTQKEDAEKAPEWVREVRKTNRELHRVVDALLGLLDERVDDRRVRRVIKRVLSVVLNAGNQRSVVHLNLKPWGREPSRL